MPAISSPYEYPSKGKCLYCEETQNLTREHIIPESLGGRIYLVDGSCLACSSITKRFEEIFARKMYWGLRLKLRIKGKRRKKSEKITHWNVDILDDESEESVSVEVAKLPLLYAVLELPPGGILLGEAPRDTNPNMRVILRGDPVGMAACARELGCGKLKIENTIDWNAYNRVLAKIAHAYTIACLGFRGLQPLLLPIIRGEDGRFPYFIGGVLPPAEALEPHADLELLHREINGDSFICVRIGLFGGRFPTYEVVSAKVVDMDLNAPTTRSSMT